MDISTLANQSPMMQAFAVFGWNTPFSYGNNQGSHPLSDAISTSNLFTFTGFVGIKRWNATEVAVHGDVNFRAFEIASKMRAAMEVTLVLVPLLVVADLVATVARGCFASSIEERTHQAKPHDTIVVPEEAVRNVTSHLDESDQMYRLTIDLDGEA